LILRQTIAGGLMWAARGFVAAVFSGFAREASF
jgi:hypothetical protein